MRSALNPLVGAVLATLVWTQPVQAEGYKWWQDTAVQGELRLTGQQVSRIEAVFQETLAERQSLRRELDRLEARLEEIMRQAGEPDAATTALITKLENTRAKRNTWRTLMLLRMYRLLTTDQRAQLLRLRRRYTRSS